MAHPLIKEAAVVGVPHQSGMSGRYACVWKRGHH